MDQMTLQQCRDLIDDGELLSEDELNQLRKEVYGLASAVVDAWDSLGKPVTIEGIADPFTPPGSLTDQLTVGFPKASKGSLLDFWDENYLPEFEQ